MTEEIKQNVRDLQNSIRSLYTAKYHLVCILSQNPFKSLKNFIFPCFLPYLGFLILCLIASGCNSNYSWREQRAVSLERDFPYIYNAGYEPPTLRLGLNEIIDIALKNNFDLEIKAQEIAIQWEVSLRDQLKMLPDLIANGENSQRNNELIVSSISVDPTIPPAPPSISTQRHVVRYDINLILNLLDYGLAYFKAEQEKKKIFLLALEYERASQTLILEIYKQYWKAVYAKIALEESEGVLSEVGKLHLKLKNEMKDRVISTTKGLKIEADLDNIQLEYINYANDYYTAMSELKLLMGLAANACFELVYDDDRPFSFQPQDICELEEIALVTRPELYIKDIEESITRDQIRYAMLQMFPGLALFASDFYDRNKYLFNHHWIVAGVRATWNLLAIPWEYYNKRSYEDTEELVRLKRVALSVGVLSQVNLAYILYRDFWEQYQSNFENEIVTRKLLMSVEDEFYNGTMSKVDVIFVRSQALIAKINAIRAYGEFQVALERLNYAVGTPRYLQNAIKQLNCQ